jgi:probable HAF family extracellular repeat protein
MQSLGALANSTFTTASDINNNGQVVGTSNTSLGSRAFAWSSDTGIVDLNTLIPSKSGIVLTSALSVNDLGLIVAIGSVTADPGHSVDLDDPHHAGVKTHAFVLIPV